MHTTKITPYLLFEYQCTSGKFIRLPNRIKSKLFFGFCPNWNALPPTVRIDAVGAVSPTQIRSSLVWQQWLLTKSLSPTQSASENRFWRPHAGSSRVSRSYESCLFTSCNSSSTIDAPLSNSLSHSDTTRKQTRNRRYADRGLIARWPLVSYTAFSYSTYSRRHVIGYRRRSASLWLVRQD